MYTCTTIVHLHQESKYSLHFTSSFRILTTECLLSPVFFTVSNQAISLNTKSYMYARILSTALEFEKEIRFLRTVNTMG
jgi:hypothetical protein